MSASWQSAKKLLWPALKMSWKVWTVVQVINLKYVPEQVKTKSLFSILYTFTVCLLCVVPAVVYQPSLILLDSLSCPASKITVDTRVISHSCISHFFIIVLLTVVTTVS